MFIFRISIFLIFFASASSYSQTYCDYQYRDLKDYELAARYEQLPSEQRPNFMAQISQEQRLKLMGMQSGHGAGSAIANLSGASYAGTMTSIFEKKLEEFKKKCGFMLR